MKILHLGNIKSGIDTYVRNSVDFASDDFEFIIVSGADDNSSPYLRHGKPLKNYKICMYRALNPIKDLMAIFQSVRILLKEKPDLLHCHSAKGGMIGRIAGFLTGTKTVYTPHAFSFLSAESPKRRAVFLALERFTRFNSRILACSSSESLQAVTEVGYNKSRTYVWNNAIPSIDGKNVEEPDEVKDREYIISIGRPSYQKNPLLMVEIMKRVHEHYPKVKFYLVGVGFYSPMLDEMKALISKYVLEDVICLVPWVDHKMTLGYLKKSSLYLSTSLYEGLPIAVLEALAMGKAIVLSDVLGNKDCVKSGVNGFLIPLNESDVAEAFSKRILFLLENEEERKKMERESLEYFQSDFCIANRIQDLERIYKEIKG